MMTIIGNIQQMVNELQHEHQLDRVIRMAQKRKMEILQEEE